MKISKYTVLLLYPDYATSQYGTDTYLYHGKALSVKDAIFNAQCECRNESDVSIDPEDLAVLFVTEGHAKDIKL